MGARLFPEWLIFYGWFYFKQKNFLALKNQSERKICLQVQRLLNGIWRATFPVTVGMKRGDRDALSEGDGTCRYSISLWQGSSHPLYSSLLSCLSEHSSTQSWSQIYYQLLWPIQVWSSWINTQPFYTCIQKPQSARVGTPDSPVARMVC